MHSMLESGILTTIGKSRRSDSSKAMSIIAHFLTQTSGPLTLIYWIVKYGITIAKSTVMQ